MTSEERKKAIEKLEDDWEEKTREGRRIQERLAYSYSYPWDCDGYWITSPEEMLEWQFGDRSKLIKTADRNMPAFLVYLKKLFGEANA